MIAGIALLIAAAVYRLLPVLLGVTTEQSSWLPGFSPIAAIMLCGAACLPRRAAIAIPFAAVLLTDVVLNIHYGFAPLNLGMLVNVLAFSAIAALGWQLRKHTDAATMLPAAIGTALFFFAVTNTYAWLALPAYAKTLAGWVQALTTGLPGFAPTWTFLRNELISNLLFTALFLACIRRAEAPAHERAPARW